MNSDFAPTDLTHHFLIAMPGLNDELFGNSVVFLCEHSPRGAMGLIINKPSQLTVGELFEKVDLPLRRSELARQPVLLGGPLQTDRGFVLHPAMGAVQAVGSDETPPAVARALREALAGLEPDAEAEPARGASARTEQPGAGSNVQPDAPAEASAPPILPSAYAASLKIAGSGLEMTSSRDVLEAMACGAGPSKILFTLGYASWGEGQLESEIGENSWLTVNADPALIFDTPLAQRYEKAMALLGLQSWMLAPGAGHA
ncbi:MAG: YqgE/AlgH family protein [Pseudomonadota bacterium]